MYLGHDIGDTREIEDGAHRRTGDEPAPLGRDDLDYRRGILRPGLMRDRVRIRTRNREEMLLCVPGRLIDRERGVSAFPETDATAPVPVADNDDQTEIEAAAAGHHARHAARVDRHLLEFAALE